MTRWYITLGKEKENVGFPRNPFDRLSLGSQQANHRRRNIRYPRHSISRSYPFYRSINRAAHEIFFFFLLASNLFTVRAERCNVRRGCRDQIDLHLSLTAYGIRLSFRKPKRAIIGGEEIRSGQILFNVEIRRLKESRTI